MANEKNPKLDANGQPIGAVAAAVGAEPPPLTSGSGSNSLAPGQRLRPRKAQAMPNSVIPESESTFFNKAGMYEGQRLVNSKGFIERGQYSSDEAYSILASYTPAERRGILNRFQQLGLYGKSKPSNSGFATRDLNATRQAFLYANAEGYTLDVAATMMVAEPGFSMGGGGSRVRTTPKQDLTSVFRQASSSILGRQMSDAQLAKFVKAYNNMEMAEATGGAVTPNVNVAAQQFVQTGAPEESTAMGALTLTNIIDKAIKGLG
jgi:hypothetical protein